MKKYIGIERVGLKDNWMISVAGLWWIGMAVGRRTQSPIPTQFGKKAHNYSISVFYKTETSGVWAFSNNKFSTRLVVLSKYYLVTIKLLFDSYLNLLDS